MNPLTKQRISGLFLAAAMLTMTGVAWGAAESCVSCHGDEKKVGPSHLIDLAQYKNTAHAEIADSNFGCRTCHDSVSANHPNDGIKVMATTNCTTCHADVMDEYYKSSHAKNAGCADCHNPHTAYAPTEVSGHDMNAMCANCHENKKMIQKHSEWLPQADLHIESLPCITCHSGSEDYVITMYIVKREEGSRYGDFKTATYDELKQRTGDKDILSLLDANEDKYISLAELRMFNRSADQKDLRLQGMMTPEKITHNFQVLSNRWDCSFCHASGPEAMQTSYIALPAADGTFDRAQVEKGAVLDAMYGTPDFYMLGSTRNPILDKIGLLIVLGGLIMPIGHGSMRFLTRKNRMGKGH